MLRGATFLAPVLYETYDQIVQYVGEHLGVPTSLRVGETLDDFTIGNIDIGFLCGLLYAQMPTPKQVKVVAAPIVIGERYRNEPIYYSDVVVRRESGYTNFESLRGACWAFNEETSHSGYNIVSYSLLKRAETCETYFGSLLKTGSHSASLLAVLDGRADAAAIDSHVLDMWFQQRPELVQHLRVVEMLGPSTIPPIVVSTRLDEQTTLQIQRILCTMHLNPGGAESLRMGRIQQLVPITCNSYDDIRCMLACVQTARLSAVPCR